MSGDKALLLVDAGSEPMEDLSTRLRALGYVARRAKSVDEGRALLGDPRFAIAAALIPPDLPALDLERALAAFRAAEPDGTLALLAVGTRPDADHRARMRRAGVTWALWRPVDDHLLRFQVNRALGGGTAPSTRGRRAVRVPTHWPVRVTAGRRDKTARLYSLSARGAFVATPRPSMPRSLVHLSLPLPDGDVRVAATVVMTNVPGNLEKRNLPVGMGLRFTGHPAEIEAAIASFAEARSRELQV